MHSTKGNTDGITFHHDGDPSGGELIININEDATWKYKRDVAVEYTPPNETFGHPGYWSVRVPYDDIKMLVANQVRNQRISALEDAEDDEILGV